MKKTLKISVMLALAVYALAGCSVEKKVYQPANCPEDRTPPATPRGVTSITGDEYVEILWFESDEPDLAGYRVYWSSSLNGTYKYMATVKEGYYLDHEVENGVTYYYAVSSFDYSGNESDLSPEDVHDTPRPAGFDLTLYDPEYRRDLAGFDFSAKRRVRYDSPAADIIADYDPDLGVFFIDVGNIDIDIQDFGYTESLDDLDWAPSNGWSEIGWVEAVQGHSYFIWTADNHYAKFRITDIGTNSILIDWAYQEVRGNPELAPPAHHGEFLRVNARTAARTIAQDSCKK